MSSKLSSQIRVKISKLSRFLLLPIVFSPLAFSPPIYRKTFTASASGEIQKVLHRKGRYIVEIRGEQASGSYDLQWELLP